MVGHSLVDQVTGDVDDVSALVVDLQGGGWKQLFDTDASERQTGAP